MSFSHFLTTFEQFLTVFSIFDAILNGFWTENSRLNNSGLVFTMKLTKSTKIKNVSHPDEIAEALIG